MINRMSRFDYKHTLAIIGFGLAIWLALPVLYAPSSALIGKNSLSFASPPVQAQTQAQTREFSGQLGASGLDDSRGVAVDQAGNVYFTGSTDGSLDGSNSGGLDAYLAKYDSSGAFQWVKQLGSQGDDLSYGVAVDSSGNAYLTGSTSGQLGKSHIGALDAWLAKYDSNGTQLWVQQLGTASDDTAYGVAVDTSGGVYITGNTFDQLGNVHHGNSDAFLAKYDDQGTLLWIEQLGTRQADSARALAVSAAGDVYITGNTADSLGGNFEGGTDAFLAKYDGSGLLGWVRQFGNTGIDESYGVAVDNSNHIVITGRTDGSLGGSNQGGFDAWVAMYVSSGGRSWTRQLGTSSDDSALGAAIDGLGNVYITGWTEGSLGGANQGGSDVWVAQYSHNSSPRWTYQFGTSQADDARGIAVDSARNFYLTGTTSGALGGTHQGGADAWIQAYSQAPSITSFSPGSGSTGTSVTILGKNFKNFTGTSDVRFGGAPATFAVNTPEQITATLPAAAVTGVITVTNSYGSANSATVFTVTTAPAVTISATPNNRTIVAGQPAIYTININRANFPGSVDLSVSGLPADVTHNFSSDPTTESSSNLRIDTTTATATGTRTLTISGTATGVTIAPITVTLTVTPPPSVTLSATPLGRTVAAGQSATYTININRTSFWGPVNLSVSGLPPGATYSFNSNPAQGQVSTLMIPTNAGMPAAPLTLTISGTASGITINPITIVLTVAHGVEWIRQEGTPGNEFSSAVAVGGGGSIYLVGGDDILLTRYSAKGTKNGERPNSDPVIGAHNVAVDSAGDIYITGHISDAWLMKYDGISLNRRWKVQLATPQRDHSRSVVVDGSDIYIAGSTGGSLGGTNPLPPNTDAWLAKFDANGNEVWKAQMGGPSFDGAQAIAARSGFVYITGGAGSNLGGTGTGTGRLFLAKYETGNGPNGPMGVQLWVHQFGSSLPAHDFASDIAVLSSGDVYVTGNSGDHASLTRFDSNGNEVWTRLLEATVPVNSSYAFSRSYALAIDNADNAYITGSATGILGGAHQGGGDAFVAKYDSNGNLIWTKQVGSLGDDTSRGIALNSSGEIFITGNTNGNLGAIYQGPLPNGNPYGDSWVAKLSPSVIPYVTIFSPTSGDPEATLIIALIIGGNFSDATAVRFNGVSAAFTVDSATQITAIVPANVATGKIVVETPYGFAYSAADFVRQ